MQIINEWLAFDNATLVAEAVCEDVLRHAQQAIAERGVFKLVLAGGTTPEHIYRLLAQKPAEWDKWYIFYGDERCLPADHKDRNSKLAEIALLDKVSIPSTQIFTIPAEFDPVTAAKLYSKNIEGQLPFDMVLLGLGEDGHTASLFPGHINPEDEAVHAVYDSPKPPAERVSLSAVVLGNTRRLLFIVTGANKQQAVKKWKAGELLPVASIEPASGVTVYSDQAALA